MRLSSRALAGGVITIGIDNGIRRCGGWCGGKGSLAVAAVVRDPSKKKGSAGILIYQGNEKGKHLNIFRKSSIQWKKTRRKIKKGSVSSK